MATIGIIGAGKIGQPTRSLAVEERAQGGDQQLSRAATLSGLVAELGPNARAATAAEAGAAGEIVVVTVPLKNYRAIPALPLLGKDRDRHEQLLSAAGWPHSRARQRVDHHRGASAGAPADLEGGQGVHSHLRCRSHHQRTAAGSKNRRALVIAGDDQAAKATVSRLIDQFGSTSWTPAAQRGWRIQRDTPGYGPRRTAEEIRRDLAAAKRYADQ